MDRFEAMKAFLRVAEASSFSEAGRQLGIPKSVVAKRVRNLESLLEVKLFHRTTRAVRLTEAGAHYVQRCAGIVYSVETIRDDAQPGTGMTGNLRISSPSAFALLFLADALCDFQAAHPGLIVELILNDPVVEPVEDNFDLVFHGNKSPRETVVARRVAPFQRVLCAAPSYLAKKGTPKSPADLIEHDAVYYSLMSDSDQWLLQQGEAYLPVLVKPRVRSNSGGVMLNAVLRGRGIAFLPTLLIADALRDGRLEQVLSTFLPPLAWISAAYPPTHRGNSKILRLIDFVIERLSPVPPWDRDLPSSVQLHRV